MPRPDDPGGAFVCPRRPNHFGARIARATGKAVLAGGRKAKERLK